MKFTAILRWALVAACGVMLACRAAAAETGGSGAKKPAAAESKAGAKAGTAAAKATAEPVSWLSSLNEGYRHALADRKPLLIVVAAKWCAALPEALRRVGDGGGRGGAGPLDARPPGPRRPSGRRRANWPSSTSPRCGFARPTASTWRVATAMSRPTSWSSG